MSNSVENNTESLLTRALTKIVREGLQASFTALKILHNYLIYFYGNKYFTSEFI